MGHETLRFQVHCTVPAFRYGECEAVAFEQLAAFLQARVFPNLEAS
jgi:hypothetical protein